MLNQEKIPCKSFQMANHKIIDTKNHAIRSNNINGYCEYSTEGREQKSNETELKIQKFKIIVTTN